MSKSTLKRPMISREKRPGPTKMRKSSKQKEEVKNEQPCSIRLSKSRVCKYVDGMKMYYAARQVDKKKTSVTVTLSGGGDVIYESAPSFGSVGLTLTIDDMSDIEKLRVVNDEIQEAMDLDDDIEFADILQHCKSMDYADTFRLFGNIKEADFDSVVTTPDGTNMPIGWVSGCKWSTLTFKVGYLYTKTVDGQPIAGAKIYLTRLVVDEETE